MSIDVQAPPRGDQPIPPPRPGRREALEPVLRRLHFLTGFLAAPIIVSLAVTGILFAWNPQIEKAIYSDQLTAVSEEPARPLADQVRAAQAARPDWTVTAVTPAAPGVFGGRDTTAVAMTPPGAAPAAGFGHAAGAISLYVDPGSAQVLGTIEESKRPGEWLRNLHSSWRLGDNVAPLTELAASWLLISLVTGLYLRWPVMRKKLSAALIPRLRTPGWSRAQAFHTTLGLWLIVPLVALVVTGLTWTSFAGSRIDDFKSAFSSPVPAATATLPGVAAASDGAPAGDGGHGDHAEHAEHGGADAAATSQVAPFSAADIPGQIDTVARGAADAGVSGLLSYTPPKTVDKAWKVDKRDQKFPNEPVTMTVDGRDGQVVDRVDWSDRPLLQQATTMGIAFHQAELFGLGNQIYLTVLGVGVVVIVFAGYRMWWLNRPPGGFGFPPKSGPLWKTVPAPLLLLFAGLIYAMPTLGISFLAYLVIERLVRALRRPKVEARA